MRITPVSLQRGASLFIAVIVLVALSIASVALLRSMDTGTLVAGNVAFKKAATASTDRGVEAAVAFLVNAEDDDLMGAASFSAGYAPLVPAVDYDFTISPDTPDVPLPQWSNPVAPPAGYDDGNTVRYFIQRMCSSNGVPQNSGCSTVTGVPVSSDTSLGSQGEVSYSNAGGGDPTKDGPVSYVYRVTVRAQGPNNTVSLVQAFLTRPSKE